MKLPRLSPYGISIAILALGPVIKLAVFLAPVFIAGYLACKGKDEVFEKPETKPEE